MSAVTSVLIPKLATVFHGAMGPSNATFGKKQSKMRKAHHLHIVGRSRSSNRTWIWATQRQHLKRQKATKQICPHLPHFKNTSSGLALSV